MFGSANPYVTCLSLTEGFVYRNPWLLLLYTF
uniref:Uncharacterized protein n=1 Tax=Siphoviridae sp. ctGa111 TaxID=2825413 RepID=A0A8S5VDQ7_9CAUD|nr:MAG TPA: hypothetical protein [Siphoviridae sp. ctGa111]